MNGVQYDDIIIFIRIITPFFPLTLMFTTIYVFGSIIFITLYPCIYFTVLLLFLYATYCLIAHRPFIFLELHDIIGFMNLFDAST